MSSADPGEPPLTSKRIPLCRHLRSKGMYVYTDTPGTDDDDDEDDFSTICWCLQTMKGFGPDDGFASKSDCRNPDRDCYEPI
jgi:hypothetical protein